MSTTARNIVEPGAAEEAAFECILDVLRERTGTDFRGYRSSTIRRRVLNRMISVGVRSFADYLVLLRDQEPETAQLLQRVTIKVSRFYRNREVFEALRFQVIPDLARRSAGEPLRIWSAGCGYGEEPYSLAMLLESVGVPGLIEATDIDREALRAARLGRYGETALGELPTEFREQYLEATEVGFVVGGCLRRTVRFTYGDLTKIPPTEGRKFDLVCCRNVLIYLAHDVQQRILQALVGAIRFGGYLCLGEAEWPSAHVAGHLESLGHKTRIFRVLDRRDGPRIKLGVGR